MATFTSDVTKSGFYWMIQLSAPYNVFFFTSRFDEHLFFLNILITKGIS